MTPFGHSSSVLPVPTVDELPAAMNGSKETNSRSVASIEQQASIPHHYSDEPGSKLSGDDRKMRPHELDAHRRRIRAILAGTQAPAKVLVDTQAPAKVESVSTTTGRNKDEPELSYVVAFLLNLKAVKSRFSANQKRSIVFKIEEKRERKRKINRLSAQRKRIRERDLVGALSDEFKDLSATNQALLQEADELRGLLSTVKKQRSIMGTATVTVTRDHPVTPTPTIPAPTSDRDGSPPQALFHLQSLDGGQSWSPHHQPALPPLDSTQWQALMALASQTAAGASFPSSQSSTAAASAPATSEVDHPVHSAHMHLYTNSPPFAGFPPPDASMRHEVYPHRSRLARMSDSFAQRSPWMGGVQRQALLQQTPQLMSPSYPSSPHTMYPEGASLSSFHSYMPLFLHQTPSQTTHQPHTIFHDHPNSLQTLLRQIENRSETSYFQPERHYESNDDYMQQQLLVSLLQSAAAVQDGRPNAASLVEPPPNSVQRDQPAETQPIVHVETNLQPTGNSTSRNLQFNCLLAALTEHMPESSSHTPDDCGVNNN